MRFTMKKSLLLALFALLALAPVFSQEKSFEYGFSLKGGTYTTQKSGEVKYRYVPTTTTYRPGYSAAAGMYAKCRLGRWMALSGELMLGFAEFKVDTGGTWPTDSPVPSPFPVFQSLTETWRYSARNVFLPICLHVGRGLNPKFSGYVGVAPLYNLETTIAASYDYSERKDDPIARQFEWVYYREPGAKNPRWQWLWSAGLEYRLGAHYALGLQMLLNPNPLSTSGEFDNSPERYPVPMKSVSATLRHNL
jgi:hypothetical protein